MHDGLAGCRVANAELLPAFGSTHLAPEQGPAVTLCRRLCVKASVFLGSILF